MSPLQLFSLSVVLLLMFLSYPLEFYDRSGLISLRLDPLPFYMTYAAGLGGRNLRELDFRIVSGP